MHPNPLEPSRSLPLFAAVVVAASLAACASPGMPPTTQMADARSALAQAESTGARDTAPIQLAAAREKLARADAALKAEKYSMAKSLFEEAQVDADLADPMARAAKAQAAATDLARSNQLLRDELDRKAPR